MFRTLLLALSLLLSCMENLSADRQLLCIGAPSVDIIKRLDREITITGRGGSLTVTEEEFDQVLNAKNGKIEMVLAGGSGANLIRVCGQLGLSCALKGRIGVDSNAAIFNNSLAKANVQSLLDVSNTAPTQRVLCLIHPNGEHTFRCCLGAADEMHSDQLQPIDFANTSIVHVEGYVMRSGNMVEKALLLAKQSGAMTSLDVGCYQLALENRERILNLLKGWIDIFFANTDEALALTGLGPQEACAYLNTLCPYVIVLAGESGCFVGGNGQVIFVPTSPVEVVDSVGAGDYFGAGFLYGVLKGYSLFNCARIGNIMGGVIVQCRGASLPDSQWDIFKDYLNAMDPFLR